MSETTYEQLAVLVSNSALGAGDTLSRTAVTSRTMASIDVSESRRQGGKGLTFH